MSNTIYEGTLSNEIYPKAVLVEQLEKALADLKDNNSNLFYFDFAGLHIELDRNEPAIYVFC